LQIKLKTRRYESGLGGQGGMTLDKFNKKSRYPFQEQTCQYPSMIKKLTLWTDAVASFEIFPIIFTHGKTNEYDKLHILFFLLL
jgi:hypothetical protein